MATVQNIIRIRKNAGLRSAALCSFTGYFSKAVSLLLVLYVANTITENDLGILCLFSAGVLLLFPFISMGVPQTPASGLENKETLRQNFSNMIMSAMLVTVFAMGALFILKDKLQQRFMLPSAITLMIPLLALFHFLNRRLSNLVIAKNDSTKYLFITTAKLLAEITLFIFLAGAMEWGFTGCIIAVFISNLIPATYGFLYFKEEGLVTNSFSIKEIAKEAAGNITSAILHAAMLFISLSGIYFTLYYTNDPVQAATFSIVLLIASVSILLCRGMIKHGFVKNYIQQGAVIANKSIVRWDLMFYTGIALLGTGIMIIIFPLVLSQFFRPVHYAGLAYYFFIGAGYFLWAISHVLQTLLLYNKEKKKILWLSLLSFTLTILFNYLFTRTNGAYGAAVTVCIVHGSILIAAIILTRRSLTQILSNNLSKADLS